MYAMAYDETEATCIVVDGKIIVCDHDTSDLFDSGLTHSFIAPHFAMTIGGRLKQLHVVLAIVTLVGRRAVCDLFYP